MAFPHLLNSFTSLPTGNCVRTFSMYEETFQRTHKKQKGEIFSLYILNWKFCSMLLLVLIKSKGKRKHWNCATENSFKKFLLLPRVFSWQSERHCKMCQFEKLVFLIFQFGVFFCWSKTISRLIDGLSLLLEILSIYCMDCMLEATGSKYSPHLCLCPFSRSQKCKMTCIELPTTYQVFIK